MALLIPKVVQSLFTQSADASRVRDNITTALQPVLDFFNQYIQVNADGSLAFIRAITAPAVASTGAVTGASLTVNGLSKLNGGTTVNGDVVIYPTTGNGVIITPPVAGPAFYVTNIGGSAATFIVYDDGTARSVKSMAAPTFTSDAGFKSVVCLGECWNNNAVGGTAYQLQKPVQNLNGGGLGLTPWVFKPSQSGSVVGLSLNQAGPITGINSLQIIKNGGLLYTWNAGAGSNNACFWVAFPKGQLPFNAGDTLTAWHYNSAAGNTQVECHATIELSA